MITSCGESMVEARKRRIEAPLCTGGESVIGSPEDVMWSGASVRRYGEHRGQAEWP